MANKAHKKEPPPTAMNSADPIRNFSLTVDERIRALTIGVPAWAARKRKIEDDEEKFVTDLIALYDKLVAKGAMSMMEIDLMLATTANQIDFTKVNKLIVDHNRYYPIEANLPMDRKGNYLVYGRIWFRDEPMTGVRILAETRKRIAARFEEEEDDE